MPAKRLQQSCVRIYIENQDGEKKNQGSGVLVADGLQHYVLTANHCIHGSNNEYQNIDPEKIWIEVQEHYQSHFTRIPVKNVRHFNQDQDWALLSIDPPEVKCDLSTTFKGKLFLEDEKVSFCGYQHANPNSYRPWTGKVLTVNQNEFKIKILDDTFDQAGEDGLNLAKGLSGSGVYIIKGSKLYLIGFLKSVVNEQALNDDINCSSLTNLESVLQDNFLNLGDIDIISEFARELDTQKSELDVMEWTELNIKEFGRLLRKYNVLYTPPKVSLLISERILEFLTMNAKIDNFKKMNGEVMLSYERSAKSFEKRVRETYTQEISDQNSARLKLRELEEDFAKHIKGIFNDNSNWMNTELARHKVTEWLMSCSFDFTENP